jgi:hypothetical protein
MNKQPLQQQGAFLVNETAANDPIIQQVMASYMERLAQEAAYREDVRSGKVAPVQTGSWHISDRH